MDHCRRGSHDCDVAERAMCSYTGGSAFVCSCLPGFTGDGRVCRGESADRHCYDFVNAGSVEGHSSDRKS